MDLRSITGILKLLPSARATIPFSLIQPGIPRGALTEISGSPGSGKSDLALKLLAENSGLRVAWIEPSLTAYPCAFPQRGLELNRVLFAETDRESLWTTHQCIRSQLFPVVLLALDDDDPRLGEIDLRRLQLSAEKSQTSVVLLRTRPTLRGAWPITLQIQVIDRQLEIIKGSGVRCAAAV